LTATATFLVQYIDRLQIKDLEFLKKKALNYVAKYLLYVYSTIYRATSAPVFYLLTFFLQLSAMAAELFWFLSQVWNALPPNVS